MLLRAGLDYWQHMDVREYDNIEQLYARFEGATFYYIENFGDTYYTEVDLSNPEEEIVFIFGKETTGIPKELIEGKEDHCLRVHMSNNVRSLNLGNTAAIVLYEALRQQGFPNID